MDKFQIKQYLLDNPNYIEDILENIGCHDIKYIKDKRIQCGLPDGDNNTSVQILLDEYLTCKIYTRNEFEKYEIKDIYTVVQFIKNYTLHEAIGLVCAICKIQYSNNNKKKSNSEAYDFIKRYKRSRKKDEAIINDDNILPESFCQRFIREECEMYTSDGVSRETQCKFGVSYDVLDNRIVFPIRNEQGQLLSFKGRTCDENYKIKDIPKFISYYPCDNNHYLFGYYENKKYIDQSDELYICEAEKGVMQLDSMEINNVVAINKKVISFIQLKKILKLNKNIVLLFDKDVALDQIMIECRKFKGLCDVYYIYDTLNLLNEKQSPMDCGIEIFNKLITECKFKYKKE